MGDLQKSLRDGTTTGSVTATLALFLSGVGVSAAIAGAAAVAVASLYAFLYRYGRKIVKRYVQKRWPSLLEGD